MFGKQCLQKCSQAHITAKFFKRLAKTRLPCYNLIVNFWHSFSNFCNRHTAWATEFVTKLCHCMQANFIYAAEKRLFVFQKCLFQPPVVRVFRPALDLVMTACGFVTLITFGVLPEQFSSTRPCDDRLRFCDKVHLLHLSLNTWNTSTL